MRADIRISHLWKISWFSYHVVRHAWRNLGYYFCKYCKVISVLRSHWFEYKTKQCLRLKQSVTVGNGEGNGTPLQYSCLENPMDGGPWEAAVHGVAKSRTRLSNFTFTFYFHVLEKEMATHSSVLAWRIPRMGEPGGLTSMGSQRVRHNWSDLAAPAATVGKVLSEENKDPAVIWSLKPSFPSTIFYFPFSYFFLPYRLDESILTEMHIF